MTKPTERFLILGATGMFGHKAFEACATAADTFACVRGDEVAAEALRVFPQGALVPHVDVEQPETVRAAIVRVRPTVVINAVGVIKQLKEAKDRRLSIAVNALFPHLLAGMCADAGAKLIHLGTDCVFNGRRGGYTEQDVPDAEDVYGLTKYLGEVDAAPALTLRTSIIGHGIRPNASLIDWFVSQGGRTVKGFTGAIYSGLPTVVLCREILRVLREHRDLTGIYQVSADPISKYDLLNLVRSQYGLDIAIEPSGDLVLDRSLDSTAYRTATGFRPPDWPDLVAAMHQDYLEHSYYRTTHEAQE